MSAIRSAAVAVTLLSAACGGDPAETEADEPADPSSRPPEDGVASPSQAPTWAPSAPTPKQETLPTASEPPAALPKSPPPTCPGMDGAAPKPFWKAIDPPGWLFAVQPTVFAFELGAAYPFGTAAPRASGTLAYEASSSTSSYAGTNVLGTRHFATTTLAAHSFENILPRALASSFASRDYGEAYSTSINDRKQPAHWTTLAGSAAYALSFYASTRIDVHGARLTQANAVAGAAGEFVERASYTQYAAFVVQISFDSSCKRDLYLSKAGSPAVDAIFPKSGDAALAEWLTKAKAQIVVRALSLGRAPELTKAIDDSVCGVADLGACNRLVEDLSTIARSIGGVPPTNFAAKSTGNSGWFVDSVGRRDTSTL
jgi:hypothetical protein